MDETGQIEMFEEELEASVLGNMMSPDATEEVEERKEEDAQ